MLPRLLLLLLALLGGACATPQAFVPAANATAISPDGQDAATEYELNVGGQRLGQMRVWSSSARESDSGGETSTLIQVGFLLVNLSDRPLRLDEKRLYLEQVTLDSGTLYRIPPLRVQGSTSVAPAYRREINVYFRLPGEARPSDVRSYQVAWAVQNGDTYDARTTFVAAHGRPRRQGRAVYYEYYYWPYYPWSYGWPYPGGWSYYGGPYFWPYYLVPYDGRGYWRPPYPPVPLPRSYLRSRHR